MTLNNTEMAKNIPPLVDVGLLLQAGINPKTGLPVKFGGVEDLNCNITALYEDIDKKNAINSIKWYRLPKGLTPDLIERILYYKGQGALFYMKTNNKFYFLPFALDGEIDVYGRFLGITPVPFNGTSQTNEDGKIKPWITGLRREPKYEVILPENLTEDDLENSCVILRDYTSGISQNIIPRAQLQQPLINVMAECVPFMRTALINNTGVSGMRVNGGDEAASVYAASNAIYKAALEGQKWIPMQGVQEFQEFNLKTGNIQDYLLAMQSLDNIRLSMHGLDNGGIFEKKAHELQTEADMASCNVSLILQDRLANRRRFCDIVNSIWGLDIWCDINEQPVQDNTPTNEDIDNEEEQNNNEDGGSNYDE